MKLLNKNDRIQKGKDYLKQSKGTACLVTEDGVVFLESAKGYAQNRANDLIRMSGGDGDILTVKADKKVEVKAPKKDSNKNK